MVTFILFWSALLSVFFFVLTVFFKALSSIINAFLVSIREVLIAGGVATIVGLLLFVMYKFVDGVIKHGILYMVIMLILFGLVMNFFEGCFSAYDYSLFDGIIVIIAQILNIISFGCTWIAYQCDRCFKNFLSIIINRVSKC